MKYIIEFEDEPCMREDGLNFYKCIQAPWHQLSDRLIKRLTPYEPENKWIPCSERLPEERGFYLTTTKDKAVYCDHWNEDNFDRTEMVIAWMPLPEPYRGGEQDDR